MQRSVKFDFCKLGAFRSLIYKDFSKLQRDLENGMFFNVLIF